jgi:hypothetical protein
VQPSTTRLDVATSAASTPPVATLSSLVSNPTNFNPFIVKIEFSRPVDGFRCVPNPLLASPSELSASPSDILASPSELLASPSELLASPSELPASPS